MSAQDFSVLFFYRLLVQTGQLDDDLFTGDDARPGLLPLWFERIEVEVRLCTACASCRMICPSAAIRMWGLQAYIVDPAACLDCSSTPCISACPTGALSDRM